MAFFKGYPYKVVDIVKDTAFIMPLEGGETFDVDKSELEMLDDSDILEEQDILESMDALKRKAVSCLMAIMKDDKAMMGLDVSGAYTATSLIDNNEKIVLELYIMDNTKKGK